METTWSKICPRTLRPINTKFNERKMLACVVEKKDCLRERPLGGGGGDEPRGMSPLPGQSHTEGEKAKAKTQSHFPNHSTNIRSGWPSTQSLSPCLKALTFWATEASAEMSQGSWGVAQWWGCGYCTHCPGFSPQHKVKTTERWKGKMFWSEAHTGEMNSSWEASVCTVCLSESSSREGSRAREGSLWHG